MHHPFDGVIMPDAAPEAALPTAGHVEGLPRRSFLGKGFALAAGALAVFSASRASAQTQFGSGGSWQGSQTVRPQHGGGGFWQPGQGQVTTYALGEEAGGGHYYPPPYQHRPPYSYRPPYYYRPPSYYRPPYGGGGQYTTMALGEESGWRW